MRSPISTEKIFSYEALKTSGGEIYWPGHEGAASMETLENHNQLAESVGNESTYKRMEIEVNGKRVVAFFPKVDTDTKIMAMVQNVLIESYVSNPY